MKIQRVDDTTVKCFLSNEELEAHDIDYKDFLLRNDKAREIVQEIMIQAQEEVGYKPPKYAFDLQIMMLPDQGMLLTFSERDPLEHVDAEQLMQCLRDMKAMLQRSKQPQQGNSAPAEDGANAEKESAAEPPRPMFAIFAFPNLRSIMEYAAALPANLRVDSRLYLLKGSYLLYLQKGSASYERYSRACVQALEFSALYSAEEEKVRYLEEHAECLIAEKALRKLRP